MAVNFARRPLLRICRLILLVLGLQWAPSPVVLATDESEKLQYTLEYLLHYIPNYYVEAISKEKLLEGAVRGLLAATNDPYTRYLDAKQFAKFLRMEEGKRVGIGVEISLDGIEDKLPIVISPIPGSSADKAGILPQDRILSIDGKSTKNLSLFEMSQLISGKKDTSLRLQIQRLGTARPLDFRITRKVFNLSCASSHYFSQHRVGYIQLRHFFGQSSGSIDVFRKQLMALLRKSPKPRALILDLRNNSGGHLGLAATLTSFFLQNKNQVIVKIRGRKQEISHDIYAGPELGLVPKNLPLLVLINGASASASEIMAGALQDHKRAKLLGLRSYGKGSVQRVIRSLPNKVGALLTMQKYFTPLDRSIDKRGLQPDIVSQATSLHAADHFFIDKLKQKQYFTKLKQKYPRFDSKLIDSLLKKAKGWDWSLPREKALLILKRSYRIINPNVPDLEIDTQLRHAMKILNNEEMALP